MNRKDAGGRAKGQRTNSLLTELFLEIAKHKHNNLAMAWIDYKKAFDMVPHSWIIESLKLAQLAPNVVDFVGRSMKSWSTEQAGCIEDKHWVR